jgi:hypothetical protein
MVEQAKQTRQVKAERLLYGREHNRLPEHAGKRLKQQSNKRIMKSPFLTYHAAGLCALPAIRAEKRPAIGKWKAYQTRRPSEAELSAWTANNPDAVCILCGQASGNVEVIDFDGGGELFGAWSEAVPADLLSRLVISRTPSGGYHVLYRCEATVCGNLKIAQRETDDGVVTLIETRGEGGLVLCSPSSGYEIVQGDLCDLPVITEDEREALLSAAWSLNEHWPTPKADWPATGHTAEPRNNSARPGDDFNARGDIRDVLASHGWQYVKTVGENEHWSRPGKNPPGTSATLKDGTFYVFSSNAAPFDPGEAYSPFSVVAMLEHGGDFEQAARALRADGYGNDPILSDRSDVDLASLISGTANTRSILTFAEDLECRAPDWLIPKLLEKDSLAAIFGAPGSGKSFLAIDITCRLASGEPWRGHHVEPGPVVYVAGEGRAGIARRVAGWQQQNGELPKRSLAFMPAFDVADRLSYTETAQAIAEEMDEPPRLIVLDTLARCLHGDENSSQDMSAFVTACDRLRADFDGATVLLVHHTGHAAGERARGSSVLPAALDAAYRVEIDSSRRIVTCTTTKLKDGEIGEPLVAELQQVELPGIVDAEGGPVTTAVIDADESADLSALLQKAGADTKEPKGKWPKIALGLVKELMADNHNQPIEVQVLRAAWSERGYDHRRFMGAVDSLGSGDFLSIEDGQIYL